MLVSGSAYKNLSLESHQAPPQEKNKLLDVGVFLLGLISAWVILIAVPFPVHKGIFVSTSPSENAQQTTPFYCALRFWRNKSRTLK